MGPFQASPSICCPVRSGAAEDRRELLDVEELLDGQRASCCARREAVTAPGGDATFARRARAAALEAEPRAALAPRSQSKPICWRVFDQWPLPAARARVGAVFAGTMSKTMSTRALERAEARVAACARRREAASRQPARRVWVGRQLHAPPARGRRRRQYRRPRSTSGCAAARSRAARARRRRLGIARRKSNVAEEIGVLARRRRCSAFVAKRCAPRALLLARRAGARARARARARVARGALLGGEARRQARGRARVGSARPSQLRLIEPVAAQARRLVLATPISFVVDRTSRARSARRHEENTRLAAPVVSRRNSALARP